MNYPAPGYVPQQAYPPAPPVQQPQYPSYPQQGFPPQQFPQQGYPAPPPQAPAVPLAQGSIDDYYGQPSTGGGPSISWDQKPIGTTYVGIVARDVTNADIQQQTNFQTKQPEFYRDGRPKFVMKVPLRVDPQQYPEFAEGEATLFVRGRMRDELVRAMGEAGVSGAPQGGAAIAVTLVGKKPSGQGLNPANVFQIQYQPPAGQGAGATSPAPAQQPVQQAPVEQPLHTIQNGDQFVQGQPQVQQAPPQQPVQPQFQPPVQQVPQPVQQQAPAQPVAPQAPADFNADQQALLARLTGQQPQAQPA